MTYADEAHHASADTYQKVLAYFKPQFTLGLTATPERADDVNILEIFKNTAHKLDIQTAVEIGALVPVRCIRIHTNIDMTKVRFNSVQYNIRDLDVKICVTERNQLIVDTWLDYAKDKRTVVFCASVKHAEQIAELFRAAGIAAIAVSGSMKTSERNGMIDLPLAWILIGIPFGIRQVGLWLLPKHHDLSGTLGVFALSILLGGAIGGFVLVYRVGVGLVRTVTGM